MDEQVSNKWMRQVQTPNRISDKVGDQSIENISQFQMGKRSTTNKQKKKKKEKKKKTEKKEQPDVAERFQ